MQRLGERLLWLWRGGGCRLSCSTSASPSSSAAGEQWNVFAAVALTRSAVIAPPMTDVELRYSQLLRRIEEENSLLSNFELRRNYDQKKLEKRAKLVKEGKELSALDETIEVTADMQEDDWEKQGDAIMKQHSVGDLSKVQKDSLTSLWRKLDEQLVLIVRQRFERSDDYLSPWILPQMENRTGETLRQTAERCVGEIVTGDVRARILSNAPFSVFVHRYPAGLKRAKKDSSVGSKIFFFNALLTEKKDLVVNQKEFGDHRWVCTKEFAETIQCSSYKYSLRTLFVP